MNTDDGHVPDIRTIRRGKGAVSILTRDAVMPKKVLGQLTVL